MDGEPVSPEKPQLPDQSGEHIVGPDRRFRLMVFAALAVLWLGFIGFGQVRARYWIRNEFQIEWKSITGIWRVAVAELPGGLPIQTLVLVSAATMVCGVLGCLYLMLVTSEDGEDPVQDLS